MHAYIILLVQTFPTHQSTPMKVTYMTVVIQYYVSWDV